MKHNCFSSTVNIEEFKGALLKLFKNRHSPWINLESPEEFDITPLTNGLSNKIYQITNLAKTGVNPNRVLLRIYGKSMNGLICKSRELQIIHKLSKDGFGPEVYFLFKNGRLEEFLEAESVFPAEIRTPRISQAIAMRLADFHSVSIDEEPKNELWDRIDEWLELAMDKFRCLEQNSRLNCVEDRANAVKFSKLFAKLNQFDFFAIKSKIMQLKQIFKPYEEDSKLVYVHCDVSCSWIGLT